MTFNEDVQIGKSDIQLFGAATDTAYASQVSTSEFTFDSVTHSAKWTFEQALPSDQYEITLTNVTDLAGVPLDGEWDNPNTWFDAESDTFPSGDGLFGSDFQFRFTILPGDANGDNVVNQADRSIMEMSYAAGGSSFGFVDGDFDGDGYVENTDDYNDLFRDNFTRVWTEFGNDFRLGDLDFDESTDFDDIDEFILAIQDMFESLSMTYGVDEGTVRAAADIDGDGDVDFDDIDDFITLLSVEGPNGLLPDNLGEA